MDKGSYGRKDRLVKERGHDSYHSRAKLTDPTVCQKCGVVYKKGRWVWHDAPESAHQCICPACQRIADRFPAGLIDMQGDFFSGHRDEIINLVHNVADKEEASHPMERIMAIENTPDGALVTTTGVHIARGIGSALYSAYNGRISMTYLDGESCVKVNWSR